MLYTPYNVPEGFKYNFDEIENSKTYEERFHEIMRLMNNHEVAYAKVIGYDDEGKTLYLDLGCGITGICKDNWISDGNTYWLNKYLVGNIVNVKIDKYDEDSYDFICSRSALQKNASEQQKIYYKKGTKVLAKVIAHNDKIVVVDIGGGNITYTYSSIFKNFDFSSQYVNIEIGKQNKRSNFWFTIDNNLRKCKIISKVADGYLVVFEDNPNNHTVMKTDEELEIGQFVFVEKKVVITTTYKFYSKFNY